MKTKIISKQIKYKGRTLKILHQKIQFDDKNIIEYEVLKRREIALIIPIYTDGNIILINQFRASINSFVTEFPAGKKNSNENIEQTAFRELNEEIGYKAGKIEYIGSFFSAVHFTDELIHVFVASNLTEGKIKHQEKEIIFKKIVKEIDVENQLTLDKIIDAKSVLAFNLYKTKLKKDDKEN